MTPALYCLLAFWIIAHFIIIFSVRTNKIDYRIFNVISVLLIIVCVFKPYTYDVKKYVVYFETGHIPGKYSWEFHESGVKLDFRESIVEPFKVGGYEGGFRLLAKLGHQLIPHGYGIPRVDTAGILRWEKTSRADVLLVLIMVVGVIVLFQTSKKLISNHVVEGHKEEIPFSIAVAIILGSMFFFLGSQNTLRQFLGVVVAISAGTMFVSRKFVLTLALLILSGWMHKWAPLLAIILVSLVMFSSSTLRTKNRYQISLWRFGREEWISLLLGVCVVIGIKAIVVLGIDKWGLSYFTELGGFVSRVDEIRSAERWQTLPKVAIVLALFFVTEALIGKTKISEALDIRLLRRCTFLFVVAFAVFSEIFSRLLVLYWAIEMIFVIWAVNVNNLRTKIAGSVVFIAYGFAPNAVNVLIGPGWYSAL